MMVAMMALLMVEYLYLAPLTELHWALKMVESSVQTTAPLTVATTALLMVDYFYSAFLTELHWALKMAGRSVQTRVHLTVDCLALLRDLCWESSTPMD